MSSFTDRVFQKLSLLEKQLAQMVTSGTVHEVKGDKLRMVIGKDQDGKDVFSPWLQTSDMRGGARSRSFFKKGQNLTLLNPTGDPQQGVILPFAPNKDFKAPDHANKSGQGEEVYQQGDLRTSKGKDGYDVWLEPEEQQQGSGGTEGSGGSGGTEGSGGQSQEEERNTGGEKANTKFRLHKDGGITGRVGSGANAMRFSATKEGVKLKAGKTMWLVVLPDKIISSVPIITAEDPIPDDDK